MSEVLTQELITLDRQLAQLDTLPLMAKAAQAGVVIRTARNCMDMQARLLRELRQDSDQVLERIRKIEAEMPPQAD